MRRAARRSVASSTPRGCRRRSAEPARPAGHYHRGPATSSPQPSPVLRPPILRFLGWLSPAAPESCTLRPLNLVSGTRSLSADSVLGPPNNSMQLTALPAADTGRWEPRGWKLKSDEKKPRLTMESCVSGRPYAQAIRNPGGRLASGVQADPRKLHRWAPQTLGRPSRGLRI